MRISALMSLAASWKSWDCFLLVVKAVLDWERLSFQAWRVLASALRSSSIEVSEVAPSDCSERDCAYVYRLCRSWGPFWRW
jgi:hypothetical protein